MQQTSAAAHAIDFTFMKVWCRRIKVFNKHSYHQEKWFINCVYLLWWMVALWLWWFNFNGSGCVYHRGGIKLISFGFQASIGSMKLCWIDFFFHAESIKGLKTKWWKRPDTSVQAILEILEIMIWNMCQLYKLVELQCQLVRERIVCDWTWPAVLF